MSLLIGLGLAVMENKKSNHALLMRYYELDKEIQMNWNEDSELFDKICDTKKKAVKAEYEKKRNQIEFTNMFLYTEAKMILYKLGILSLKK